MRSSHKLEQQTNQEKRTCASWRSACPSPTALVLFFCIMACIFSLSGCRFSDELTEYIYQPTFGSENMLFEPIYQEAENAPEDPTRVSAIHRETYNRAEQEAALPTYDSDAPEDGTTKQRVFEPGSSNDLIASAGTLAKPDQGKTEEPQPEDEPESTQTGDDSSTQVNTPTESGTGDSTEADDAPIGSDTPTGGSGGEAVIVEEGRYEDLPEDVQCIAACGQYAIITQMLSGRGGLAATDEDTLNLMLSYAEKGAFSYDNNGGVFAFDEAHEGLTSVAAAFSKDGTGPDSLDMEALLAAFNPHLSRGQACALVTDGASPFFSSQEKEQLKQHGISVIYVPLLGKSDTSDESIVTGVQVIGELLRTANTQYDAAKMSALYASMRSNNNKTGVFDVCKKTNNGYSFKAGYEYIYQGDPTKGTPTSQLASNRVSTAYLAGWKAFSPALSFTKDVMVKELGDPLYLHDESVEANGVGTSDVLGGGFAILDYYLQHSGVVNHAYSYAHAPAGKAYAVTAGTLTGLSEALPGVFSQDVRDSALSYFPAGFESQNGRSTLGDADFPAVLVADSDIADELEKSANNVRGAYNMGKPFQIIVVPQGITGSWAKGNVESFLMAAFALEHFGLTNDAYTSATTLAFYNAFFRTESSNTSIDYQDIISNYEDTRTTVCPTERQAQTDE